MVKISFLEWFAYIITIVGFIVMGIFLYHMCKHPTPILAV